MLWQAKINCADAQTASWGQSQFYEAKFEEYEEKKRELKAPWSPFLSLVPHRPCFASFASAIVGKVLILVETEFKSWNRIQELKPARPNNLDEFEHIMVWYGMVWYGMVWYDMVRYGMVAGTAE